MSCVPNLRDLLDGDFDAEYRTLEESLESARKGKKVTTTEAPEQKSVPYLGADAMRGFVTQYTSDSNALLCNKDDVLMLWDGSKAGEVATGLEGCVASTVMRLRPNLDIVDPIFLTHFLKDRANYILSTRTGSGIPHVNKDLKKMLLIPLPPLEIQKAIADTLDKFTQLEAELEAELEARVKQYEYYREDVLLNNVTAPLEKKSISDCLELIMNKQQQRDGRKQTVDAKEVKGLSINNGTVPILTGGSHILYTSRERIDALNKDVVIQEDCVIAIPGGGNAVSNLKFFDGGEFLNSNNFIYKARKNVNLRYFYHYLKHFPKIIMGGTTGEGLVNVSSKTFESKKVNVPPLRHQDLAATRLDNFEKIINDFQSGIPAEIAARRQQYEYYRKKLLTFSNGETVDD